MFFLKYKVICSIIRVKIESLILKYIYIYMYNLSSCYIDKDMRSKFSVGSNGDLNAKNLSS